MPGQDRLTALLEQPVKRVTGIDFIQVVDPTVQTLLRVFFLIDPDALKEPIVATADLPRDVPANTVRITNISGGERLAQVRVRRATYLQVANAGGMRTVLEVKTAEPGDFSLYRLTILDDSEQRIDPFFNGVEFSFKQGCPSVLDCQRAAPECPPEQPADFPVDYLARDFTSLRNALLDFAAQRYPQWTQRIEADAGVMLAEILAALGDELSYIQDRYAREAYLETASQRRSLRHHTRLLDYAIHDGLTASTFLDLSIQDAERDGPDGGTYLNAGSRVWALSQGRSTLPFELGAGLGDQRKTQLTLLFSIGPKFQAVLNDGVFTAALRQRFADNRIFFEKDPSDPSDLSLKITKSPDGEKRWVIANQVVEFLAKLEDDKLNIYGVGRQFWVHAAWNAMRVHVPDAGKPCLEVGATELFLRGTLPTRQQIPRDPDPAANPAKFWVGKWLLLKTQPHDPAVPARRHLVRVVEVEHLFDRVHPDASASSPPRLPITRIRWEDEQALPFEMCLSDLVVRGNLVEATAGETVTEFFRIPGGENALPALQEKVSDVVERQGPLDDSAGRRSVTYLYSLRQSETHGLGWLGRLREAAPEVELQEVEPREVEPREDDKKQLAPLPVPQIWQWQRSLLDTRGFQDVFALDDGAWRRVIGFNRRGEVIEHIDYASGSGFTIRFGDGEFGKIPQAGTIFRVRYHTGPGAQANLAPDTVVNLSNPQDATQADLARVVAAVTNPLPITSGVDPEAAAAIKQSAPEAFRAVTRRAVRPEDYAEIAERLPWVQRAGARFRWTGSWLSASVTADPLGSFELSPAQRTELENLMACVRQAGREVFVRNPRFVNIDLEITICVEPFAYAGQVKARVLEALVGRKGVRPTKGFFDPDNFTFGTPLRRAALEAAIQSVVGVRMVEKMCLRARGVRAQHEFAELTFDVGQDQIIRLQNDPRFPERGSLRIMTRQEQGAGTEGCQP